MTLDDVRRILGAGMISTSAVGEIQEPCFDEIRKALKDQNGGKALVN
ncbi:MAG: hypothetical protein GY769_06075 [bacterium]|nr:hypothetical protein [bacterium]